MSNIVQQEELKRDRHLDAREKWRLILAAISWAEVQPTVRRNTPQRCLAEQARKLGATVPSGGEALRRRR